MGMTAAGASRLSSQPVLDRAEERRLLIVRSRGVLPTGLQRKRVSRGPNVTSSGRESRVELLWSRGSSRSWYHRGESIRMALGGNRMAVVDRPEIAAVEPEVAQDLLRLRALLE